MRFPALLAKDARILLRNADQGRTLILEVSDRNTETIAHCRTRRFNILHIQTHKTRAAKQVRAVLQYYFQLFLANDGELPRDNQQANAPPAHTPRPRARIAFKPLVRAAAAATDHFLVREPEPDIPAHTRLLLSPGIRRLETVLYISDPYDLKYFPFAPFRRIYFGNEYCERLLPAPDQLRRMISFADQRQIPLTLTTPVCTDAAFPVIEALLDMLAPRSEVVFNDWGLVPAIAARGLTPVHGRHLWTIRKDPRILDSGPGASYHRLHNLQPAYQKYMTAQNVARVELDNVKQGFDLSLAPELSATLYYPSVCCAITRKCLFANLAAGRKKFMVTPECAKPCAGCRPPTGGWWASARPSPWRASPRPSWCCEPRRAACRWRLRRWC